MIFMTARRIQYVPHLKPFYYSVSVCSSECLLVAGFVTKTVIDRGKFTSR